MLQSRTRCRRSERILTSECARRMATSADGILAALAVGAVPAVGLLVGLLAGAFTRLPHHGVAVAMSVGAGALLAMTAETMIPEAFHNNPRFSGLLAAFGFGLLVLVDATAR